MKRLLSLVAVFATSLAGATAEPPLELANNGKTAYQIVLPADAIESERHAAEELAAHLKQATGADFPITAEPNAGDGPNLWVGFSERAKAISPDRKVEAFGPEEFVIETHPPHLLLAGGRPRGTLYAIYTFLEDQLACRWFSSTVSRVPKQPSLAVGMIKDHQLPGFEYREPFALDSYDGDWSARNKCNGHSSRLDAKRGGQITYQGFVHTLWVDRFVLIAE